MKAAALGFSAVLALAVMGEAAADEGQGWSTAWKPGPVFTSPKGKVVIKTRGRLIVDHAWISDSDGVIDFSGSEVRAARLGVDGKVGNHFFFRLESDFTTGVATPTDLYIGWKGAVEIQGGHFRIGPSLEGATSSRFLPLFERAPFIEAFGLSRLFGAAVTKVSANGTATLGVFKGGFLNKGYDSGVLIVTRVNHAFPVTGGFVHVGGAARYREPGEEESNLIYRARPIQHQAPRFVGTGPIGESDVYLGAELGLFRGPLSLHGDMAVMKVNLAAPSPGQGNPTFVGGYINVSYFLTGEDVPYDPAAGALGRPKVKRPVFQGGPGAWQAVARFDVVDLTDNGVSGGVQKTAALALNWWLTSHLKVAVMYSHSAVRQNFLFAALGADGADTINAFGLRTQFDW